LKAGTTFHDKLSDGSEAPEMVAATSAWRQLLRQSLQAAHGGARGNELYRSYGEALAVDYREHFSPMVAAADIDRLAAISEGESHAAATFNIERGSASLRVVTRRDPLELTQTMSFLASMGFAVGDHKRYEITLEPGRSNWLHDLDLGQNFEHLEHDGACARRIEAYFLGLFDGSIENDGLNQLVLRAGLAAREVKVLRAYCKYLRQARIAFSQTSMEETLKSNPLIARRLVDLFLKRFDPAAKDDGAKPEELASEIRDLLEQVSYLDEDRIIRRFLNIIEATLRTNFFQPAADGGEKSYISFKLNSQNIEELPLPRPFREIFVYSPQVEGVHLRFGKVARGGLRWSDRYEDLRTEILGLVKAQQVKNAVIVPVGSKGGFVVKRPPPPDGGREAFLEQGIECYKTFIRGLLDITDNLKGTSVVAPPDVVRKDEDDPYLVVAADKGTATFSDIANGVSVDYGFWLDDAFASGGSAGYDHKKMGITARGAWESVKRHFRELGKDIQNEDFTCIGVGDMAGDVPRSGKDLGRTQATVRAAALGLERLRRKTDLQGRRRVQTLRQVAQGQPPDEDAVRHRPGPGDAERVDQRHAQGGGRAALVRRHRHLRQGKPRNPRRCR
jgi:glutamate dehydrogenase